MPNNEKPASKTRIDPHADKALADLENLRKAHPELQAELQPIEDSLKAIAMDNHKAR